ncbi:MAG: hypothetical protein FD143_2904 [Ignavibacteria bacterium]|nr:MAG: hypothetical protein FD143_2904 [Ignavibacteria bacterium]
MGYDEMLHHDEIHTMGVCNLLGGGFSALKSEYYREYEKSFGFLDRKWVFLVWLGLEDYDPIRDEWDTVFLKVDLDGEF